MRAAFGQSSRQPGPGHHRGEPMETTALASQVALDRLHDLSEQVLGLSIFSEVDAGRTQQVSCGDLEGDVRHRLADHPRLLGGRALVGGFIHIEESLAHVEVDPPEPPGIIERPGQAFGLAEQLTAPLDLSKQVEHIAQIEPQIDALLGRLARLRSMRQGVQRLFEAGGRLPVGRCRERLGPGLTEVQHGLLPHLTRVA